MRRKFGKREGYLKGLTKSPQSRRCIATRVHSRSSSMGTSGVAWWCSVRARIIPFSQSKDVSALGVARTLGEHKEGEFAVERSLGGLQRQVLRKYRCSRNPITLQDGGLHLILRYLFQRRPLLLRSYLHSSAYLPMATPYRRELEPEEHGQVGPHTHTEGQGAGIDDKLRCHHQRLRTSPVSYKVSLGLIEKKQRSGSREQSAKDPNEIPWTCCKKGRPEMFVVVLQVAASF